MIGDDSTAKNIPFVARIEKYQCAVVEGWCYNWTMISVWALFRYADTSDYILLSVAAVCACAHGVILPLFSVLTGNLINSFEDLTNVVEALSNLAWKLFILGVAAFILSIGQVLLLFLVNSSLFFTKSLKDGLWNIAIQNIMSRIRVEYFEALLKQEIRWFDQNDSHGSLSATAIQYVSKTYFHLH